MSTVSATPQSVSGDRLALVPLDEDRWRLCDTRVPRSDAAHVVAYIERTPDGLDVVWLMGGRLPTRYARLEQIIAAATRLVSLGDSRGARRPVPIPHLAPAPTRRRR